MENKLSKLFDYQRFENNSKLSKIISDTQSRYGTEVSEDFLDKINAAGVFDNILPEEKL